MKVVILKVRKNSRDKAKILGVFTSPKEAEDHRQEIKHNYPTGYEFIISDSYLVDKQQDQE